MPQSFIEHVVEEVWSRNKDLDNIVFVLPSRRAGTFLKNYLAKKSERTVFAPEIYSIESFIEKLSGISYASNTELLFTLYFSYLKVIDQDHESFADFSKWARTLLMDFNEIDRYLIPQAKIFSYLSAISEVNHWYLQKDKTQLMENYIAFWNSLEPMYTSFKEMLLGNKKGHQGLIYRMAYENLSDYLENNKSTQHIFLGFNALNEAESRIIQAFITETPSRIFWDIDRHFIDSTYHDAGFFIRDHIKKWPYYKQRPFSKRDEGFLAEKNIRITGVPKNVSQAKYIGQLLQELAETKPSELDQTAVVLGDESLLNPVLNALPPSIEKVNITMGYPLRNIPIAGLFEQLFDLYLNPYPSGWPYKKVLSVLSLPQIQSILNKEEKAQFTALQQLVHRRNILSLSPSKISDYLGETGRLIFNRQNENVPHFIQNALGLIELMKNRAADEIHTLEEEHLFGFYTIFNQLLEMTSEFPYVKDIRSLHSLFLELIAEQTIDFQGEPLQGLQIMGMLESRVLDFKTVIISSVNEGILPSGKQVNSFIPYDLKKEFGLPTYKEKDAVYTYHFYRLLQRAQDVHLIYNTEPDVLVGGEPSRFIYQLTTENKLAGMVHNNLATMEIQSQRIKPIEVFKGPLLMEEIEKYAANGFSPTSLTQYIRDPLEFYKKFILKIDDSPVVEEAIAANTFGTIIHDSIEELLKPYVGTCLDADIVKSIKPKVNQVVKKHFTKFYDEVSVEYGRNSIAFHVLIRNIINYLDYEIQTLQSGNIKLIALEKKMEIKLDIPGIPFPVRLKGKLDRIDELDGQLRIIDYKTGRTELSNMNVVGWSDLIQEPDLSKAFQVLCYAFISWPELQHASLKAGIISFKNLKEGFMEFGTKEKKGSRSRNTVIDAEVLELFRDQLFQLLREICDPNSPFVQRTD